LGSAAEVRNLAMTGFIRLINSLANRERLPKFERDIGRRLTL
jgi:hypothetical protein